jgi:hypothetical protein
MHLVHVLALACLSGGVVLSALRHLPANSPTRGDAMTYPLWWLYWVTAFIGVLSALSIACALREWWLWRKERK